MRKLKFMFATMIGAAIAICGCKSSSSANSNAQTPSAQTAANKPAQPASASGAPADATIQQLYSSQSPTAQNASGPANAQQRQRGVLPRGFQIYNDPQGSGRVVFVKFSGGSRSASGAMRDFLSQMNGYFDAPPRFLAAVGDPQDRVVQAMWTSSFSAQPIRGVATVVIGQSDATFAMMFDRPQTFAASYSRLTKALTPQMPKSSGGGGGEVSTANWTRQTMGDRSAAATLPPGWHMTDCVNGAMDIVGPNKQVMALGLAFPIFSVQMPGSKPGTVAPYMDPVHAIMFFETGMNTIKMQQTQNSWYGRLIETTPAQNPGGQGIYALQESNNENGHRKGLILMMTSQMTSEEWLLYTSYAISDASTFQQDLPIMMKIWASWKVDDRVYQQRMQQALASMKETSNILTSQIDNQMHAYDNSNYAVDMTIRGHWPVENTETGERVEVDQNMADALEKACQDKGLPCRQVPINQLTGGH
jgi:hypothetical protein